MFTRHAAPKSHFLIRQYALKAMRLNLIKHPSLFRVYPHSPYSRGSVKALKAIVTFVGIVGSTYWYVQRNSFAFADSMNMINSKSYATEEPESKLLIPTYISLYDGTNAKLVGLGIRTISFLKMKVYVIAMYIRESDIEILKKWKGYDKAKFLSSNDESVASNLLDQPVDIAIRIEPVRNTNGQHLRDGFVRALTNRMQNGHLDDDDVEGVLEALKEFKAQFPKSLVKTGTAMILTKQRDGYLRIEYEGTHSGVVKNKWLAKNLLMGYLAADNPISEKAKISIAEGFDNILNMNNTV
ncbi:11726_t:CDS:2 [Racocetra persica]|uniref:11726_t:CDS:1 n=1 Tax=Racocetra persica TaxID=160502 RepID=A0ACA9LG05_9GLOM|nr:11726_t:CDS:2 [Racocetra persica]